MDLLAQLFAGGGTPGPTDDWWYQPVGGMTAAGIRVDSEGAQKISAWFRGRQILATVLAMLPLPVYRRLPDDGGSEPAYDLPLYSILHDAPNGWQDSFQWRMQKMFHLIDHGNGYDRIVSGARGFVHELQPIHPTLVTPKQIKGGAHAGRILYDVRDEQTGQTTTHTQDEIFHLRGASDDGIRGKGILEYARSSLGTALATEAYAGRIFGRGTLNGGTIEVPGAMDKESMRALAQSFVTSVGDWHVPQVMPMGAKWVQNSLTPEDAQMLLSRKFSIDDMARWLGVPRQMLENSDPSFGNAEQFDESFLTYSMGHWLSLFEFGINGQLILQPGKFYAEFTRDAIARGKLIDRWNVHVAAVNAGIKSVDEARVKEGMNRRGGKAGELREPQNITGKPAASIPSSSAPPPSKQPPASDKAQAIAQASAARLLRKEVTAVQKLAVRHAADQGAFAAAITEFYDRHAELVSVTLMMDADAAREYCAAQAAQALGAAWLQALELWDTEHYARGLAAIALEGEAA
jgi:HK97 family phage portal protein